MSGAISGYVLTCVDVLVDAVAGRVGRKDSQRKTSLLFTEQGQIRFKLFIIYSHGDVTLLEW